MHGFCYDNIVIYSTDKLEYLICDKQHCRIQNSLTKHNYNLNQRTCRD